MLSHYYGGVDNKNSVHQITVWGSECVYLGLKLRGWQPDCDAGMKKATRYSLADSNDEAELANVMIMIG